MLLFENPQGGVSLLVLRVTFKKLRFEFIVSNMGFLKGIIILLVDGKAGFL